MTHHCCHQCRLHLASAAVPETLACPDCERPLEQARAIDVLGYRRSDGIPVALRSELAAALARRPLPPGPAPR